MELVNGYPCFNCTDVDLAKKGINPAKPQDDPRSPNYDPNSPKSDSTSSSRDGSAVTFGGSLVALNGAQSSGRDGSSLSGSPQQQQARQSQPGSALDISV